MPLISFGEALVDMFPTAAPNQFIACPGGAPANVAVAFACQGRESYFVGGLAQDGMAAMLEAEMCKRGVNTDYCPRFEQALTSLVMVTLNDEGERSFRFYREGGADTLFHSVQFKQELFSKVNIFHFNSNTLTSKSLYQTSLDGVALAKRFGLVVSFDLNLRLSLWADQELAHLPERVDNILSDVHIVKMAKEELAYLANAMNLSEQQCLQNYLGNSVTRLIVVTDGSKPVCAYTRDGKLTVTPLQVKVVDSTGAGDAFLGGLLAHCDEALEIDKSFEGWLEVQSLENALVHASACGAKACQKKGAFEAME